MTAEAQTSPIADFLAWHTAALERDNQERRGPALTATRRCVCGGIDMGADSWDLDTRPDCPVHGTNGTDWAADASAAAWPPDAPPPF